MNKLFHRIFLIFLLLLIASCEKEEVSNELTDTESSNNHYQKENFNDLLKNKQFHSAITEFGLFDHRGGISELKRKEVFGTLTINLDSVIKFERDGYVSYTFSIEEKAENKSSFQNLVIQKEGGVTKGFIMKYSYSENYLEHLKQGIRIPFEGTVRRTTANSDLNDLLSLMGGNLKQKKSLSKSSIYVCEDTYVVGERKCLVDGHSVGEKCEMSGSSRAFYYTRIVQNCWYESSGPGWSDEQEVIDYIASEDFGGGGPTTAPYDICNDCRDFTLTDVITQRLGLFAEEQIWLESLGEDPFVVELYEVLLTDESMETKILLRNIISSAKKGSMLSYNPFFQYFDKNYMIQYPKLTEYLKNKMPKVAEIPVILNTIHEITQLPIEQIKEDLQWGKGPTIKIVQLNEYAPNTGPSTVGAFDKNTPEIILLDVDWVKNLESDYIQHQDFADAMVFFLGVSILHEYVHYGDNLNGDIYRYPTAEEGDEFEMRVYGGNVSPSTLTIKNNTP